MFGQKKDPIEDARLSTEAVEKEVEALRLMFESAIANADSTLPNLEEEVEIRRKEIVELESMIGRCANAKNRAANLLKAMG